MQNKARLSRPGIRQCYGIGYFDMAAFDGKRHIERMMDFRYHPGQLQQADQPQPD